MIKHDSGTEINHLPYNTYNFDDSVRFIRQLAIDLGQYVGYTHETDKTLHWVIRSLGLSGEIIATPETLVIALWQKNTDHQTIHLAVTGEPGYDMERLEKVRDLVNDVEAGLTSPADGLIRLREIELAPALYENYQKAFAYFLSGTGFGVLMGISWPEVFIGGLLCFIAFGFELFSSRVTRLQPSLELFVATLVAFLATLISVLLPGIHPLSVTVSALTIYIPGFGLTIAPREIIAGNTLSGVIYFTKALFVSLKLLLGALLGLGIIQYLQPAVISQPLVGVLPVFTWIFVPFLVICNGILFGVPQTRFWQVIVGGVLVWAGVQIGNTLGFWQGTFLGALILTFYARTTSRWFKTPLATVLLPVVLILVPGLNFIEAIYTINTGGVSEGVRVIFQEFSIVLAIISGVFVGDIIGSIHIIKERKNERKPGV